jgi:hypothetical protein
VAPSPPNLAENRTKPKKSEQNEEKFVRSWRNKINPRYPIFKPLSLPDFQIGDASRAQHQCFCLEKRIYHHYKEFKKRSCCRRWNQCCSAEADRNLGYRDFAMRIRLFIIILTLLLCVVAARADKPMGDKRLGSHSVCRQRSRGTRPGSLCNNQPVGDHIYQFWRRIPNRGSPDSLQPDLR